MILIFMEINIIMLLTKLLKLITIIALCAAIAWFIYEPGFEPVITFIVILAAMLKLHWDEVKHGLAPAGRPVALKHAAESQEGKEKLSDESAMTAVSSENTSSYSGGSFTGSDFSGMDMAGYIAKKADYRGARFTGANLAGAHLKGSNFENADFKGANLSQANLKGANLKGANLDDADLTRAILIKANLRGASIKNTKLAGANMKKTKMPGPVPVSASGPETEKVTTAAQPLSTTKDEYVK